MGRAFTWVWTVSLIAVAAQGTRAQEPPGAVSATQASSLPAELGWRLSSSIYPKDISKEVDYLRYLREQRDRLIQHAEASSGTPTVYDSAVVNWVLARELEPFASRWLLGLSQPADEVAIRSALAFARQRLEAAAGDHATSAEAEPPQPEPDRALLETLQAFTTALQAVWTEETGEVALQARRDGVVALAVLLEHEHKDVASAALLWQAVLYRQMGRLDRALQVLPAAVERVDPQARAYQFFARLLRSRLVADRGGFAVAYALLLDIEERSLEWFGTEETRAEAAHVAMRVRWQVLEQWRGSLDPNGQTEEMGWCTEAMERIRTAASTEGNEVRLLRLGETIPLLGRVPDLLKGDPQ